MERIEKNFLWLSAANIISTVLNALLIIYIARVLEAEFFGYYSYATALVFYLFNFVDLGLSTYGIRQVAKAPAAISEYISNIISFRLLLAAILFSGVCVAAFLMNQPMVIKLIMVEAALMLFCAAFAAEWAFQGVEKMHMVFISFTATPFLQLFLNVMFVRSPADVLRIPVISFISSIPVIALFLYKLKFRLQMPRINFKRIRLYLSSSVVIWGISVLAQAYNGLDIVMLGVFRKPEEVGCFTVARRIVGGAATLMILLANAVLPRLSATFVSDLKQFNQATAKFLKISCIIIALVLVPLVVFSSQIITLTVGAAYVSASVPLKIMAMALILVMFNLPYSTGLIAASFEKDVLKQACASALASLILNLVLMPKYGMIGASISFLLAESLALTWILVIYNKRIRRFAPA